MWVQAGVVSNQTIRLVFDCFSDKQAAFEEYEQILVASKLG